MPPGNILKVGRILAAFGIKGWVKVHSDTAPRENLLDYAPWHLWRNDRWQEIEVAEAQAHSKGIVVRLRGIEDRSAAEALAGIDIGVSAESLPALPEGEFYWRDLIGLAVVNTEGVLFGVVGELLETGANDVLVVKPCEGSVDQVQRLMPWVQGEVVQRVDMAAQRITVDWGVDY
ncbi:MAG: ribosome maturation factor RimM [Pseudomonadota bacterium]